MNYPINNNFTSEDYAQQGGAQNVYFRLDDFGKEREHYIKKKDWNDFDLSGEIDFDLSGEIDYDQPLHLHPHEILNSKRVQQYEYDPNYRVIESDFIYTEVHNKYKIFNYTVDKRVADKLSELEAKMDSKYGTYINSRLVSEGDKMISDFAEAKKIDVDEARELGKYAVNHRVSLDDAYKVAYFDKIPLQAKQEALQDLNLKKSANLENGNIPAGVTPVMPENPTIAQAFEAAKRELGIK